MSPLPRRLAFVLVPASIVLLFLSLGPSRSRVSLWTFTEPPPAHLPEDLSSTSADQVVSLSSHAQDTRVFGIFSHVLVVSRPVRLDRRAAMDRLLLALGFRWSYIDAASADDQIIGEIESCVRSFRRRTRLRSFQWIRDSEFEDLIHSSSPSSLELSTLWDQAAGSCISPVPPRTLRTAGDILASDDLHVQPRNLPPSLSLPLTCSVQDRTHGLKYKPTLPFYMLLTPPKLACWYSHLSAIQQVAAFGEPLAEPGMEHLGRDAVLILEDDVDMEQDIQARLQEVWEILPQDWDIVFLGHCWSDEARHAALRDVRSPKPSRLYPNMTVHPSFAPKCTHAYALSRAGARRLLVHLLHPPFAYSRALDQAIAWLVQSRRLKAFSVVPSVVIQHRTSVSDIDGGEDGLGSGWKDNLDHGSL